MRARSIKPGICDNEVLGTADPFFTLLFERLWMIADREGRLEDRPLRIKAQAFPYRDGLDVEPMLVWLADNGFIQRYSVDGKRFIQVLNFSKHQSPHKNEQNSVIPSPAQSTTMAVPEHNHGSAMDALTPSSLTADSGLLTPDSPSASATPTRSKSVSRETNAEPEWWLDFKLAYPNRSGDQGWRKAQRASHARMAEGHVPSEFIDGAKRYAAYCEATQKTGTEFVKQACSFLGPDKPFLLPWTPPLTKAQVRQDKNISASVQWLQEQEANDGSR